MPRRTDILKIVIVIALFATAFASAQVVLPSGEVPCSNEKVDANLKVKAEQRVSGEVKDQSGAALALSRVELRMYKEAHKFVAYRTVMRDREGHFDFGLVDPGKYRFLPSSSRAFKQPKQVDCVEGEACELKLELEANPTHQLFYECPIQ
jgi:hypothetical protein